jgi:Pyridine nucleotide-disulphide oxidoreductase, dimerisation domain
VSEVAKTETYTRAYAESNGFLTLLSDGERLTGAYALGPEAGEWLQQATLAVRARVPLDVMRDTIQPFPTFSEIYVAALKTLCGEIRRTRTTATTASSKQREPQLRGETVVVIGGSARIAEGSARPRRLLRAPGHADRLGNDRRTPCPDGQPGARGGTGSGQPDRRGLRRHAPVSLTPRRRDRGSPRWQCTS